MATESAIKTQAVSYSVLTQGILDANMAAMYPDGGDSFERYMEDFNQMIADGIRENASVVQDQDEYEKRYKMLCDRADGIKAKCNILESQIEDRSTRRGAIEHFLTALERQAAPVAEFDPAAFHLLTERMTVHENGHITIQFKDGTEITE